MTGIALVFVVIVGVVGGSPIFINQAEASPGTIYVPDDYASIQAAVNASSPGDTIIVRDGTYTDNVDVNKSLTIRSENGASFTTIKAADVWDHVFDIMADEVSISGFTITGVRALNVFQTAPIFVYAVRHCNISENYISPGDSIYHWSCGILLDHTSNSTFSNNSISAFGGNGIRGDGCDYNNISDNVVTGMDYYAIWLMYSDGNIINNNTVSNSNGGMELKGSASNRVINNALLNDGGAAISLWVCPGTNYIENNICNSSYHGMYIDGSYNQRIIGNTCSDNEVGIGLQWGSAGNVITENILSNNTYGIRVRELPTNNEVYLNDFVNNGQSVYFTEPSPNIWSSPSELIYVYNTQTFTNHLGNFWSDYAGSDADADGIGDTAYLMNGDSDSYPLMEPFENYTIAEYDLTIDSTPGGSVITPGEGTYTYYVGTIVSLMAVPDAGYRFVEWIGDVDTIPDVNDASTNITMNDDYSIMASFEEAPKECIATASGNGTACFTPNHGIIEDLEALPSIPPSAPAGIMFPYGMFSFRITGLELAQEVTITIELPGPVHTGTRWWKEHMGAWYSVPVTVVAPNMITITLTDGVFPGDSDKTEDTIITDPGGPGYPGAVGWEVFPISKARVLVPWIALLAAIIAGASLLVLRRRRTPS
jgi:parallel beta-helix repeat protein